LPDVGKKLDESKAKQIMGIEEWGKNNNRNFLVDCKTNRFKII